jgi:hypothetical protein
MTALRNGSAPQAHALLSLASKSEPRSNEEHEGFSGLLRLFRQIACAVVISSFV